MEYEGDEISELEWAADERRDINQEPIPQTEPMSAEDYVKFYNDVKIHFEMLCTDRMRRHAYADPVAHDLAFQVFRILSGYEQALEESAQLDRDILTKAADRCCVACACEDSCVRAQETCERIDAILAPLDEKVKP